MKQYANRKPRNVLATSAGVMLLLLLPSCAVMPKMDNGAELISHPQFEAATLAAPDWVELVLDRVAQLEHQIEAGQ